MYFATWSCSRRETWYGDSTSRPMTRAKKRTRSSDGQVEDAVRERGAPTGAQMKSGRQTCTARVARRLWRSSRRGKVHSTGARPGIAFVMSYLLFGYAAIFSG